MFIGLTLNGGRPVSIRTDKIIAILAVNKDEKEGTFIFDGSNEGFLVQESYVEVFSLIKHDLLK